MRSQAIELTKTDTDLTRRELRQLPELAPIRRGGIHPVVWIVLVGLFVRVALWFIWSWSPLLNDDARDYQGLADRLVTTGTYSDAHGNLISLRPPLYPAILAGIYFCFGLENDNAVRAIQAGVSLLTVLLVYRLGVLVYSQRVAVWAAGLFCFYPSLLGYSNLLLSETYFTFFVVGFTWLVLEAVHRQKFSILAAAGIVMGLAALTRSILLLFAPLLAVFLWLSWKGTWSRRTMAAILPVAVFVAVIAPWAGRNTRVQSTFTTIDVMGGRNAMMGNYEYTPLERSWATISDVTGEQAWYRVLAREHPEDATRTQGQLDKLALHHALDFMWTHPWLTAQRDVVKFFNFWQLEREFPAAARDGYFGELAAVTSLALAAIFCGSYAAVLLIGLFGVCCVPPIDLRNHFFLVMSILFPCAVHTLIFAHSRYHLPVIPLLTVYSAAAIVYRQAIWQRRRTWGFLIATALSMMVAVGWFRELVFVDFNLLGHLFG
jgi:4-amino-4-deoxy-L-arabinose transferase-like glycosyltransferase